MQQSACPQKRQNSADSRLACADEQAKPNGFDQEYTIETPGLNREAIVQDITKTLPILINADCGTQHTPWIATDNSDSFECRATNSKTKKPYRVRITRKGTDIDYHATEL